MAGGTCIFELGQEDLLEYLLDRADEPCGRSVPARVLRYVNVFFSALQLESHVGRIARSLAKRLRDVLPSRTLLQVRTASTPLLSTCVPAN